MSSRPSGQGPPEGDVNPRVTRGAEPSRHGLPESRGDHANVPSQHRVQEAFWLPIYHMRQDEQQSCYSAPVDRALWEQPDEGESPRN